LEREREKKTEEDEKKSLSPAEMGHRRATANRITGKVKGVRTHWKNLELAAEKGRPEERPVLACRRKTFPLEERLPGEKRRNEFGQWEKTGSAMPRGPMATKGRPGTVIEALRAAASHRPAERNLLAEGGHRRLLKRINYLQGNYEIDPRQ